MPDADGYEYVRDDNEHHIHAVQGMCKRPYTVFVWIEYLGTLGLHSDYQSLTRPQAARLAALLQEYADTGTIAPPKEEK